MRRYRAHYDVTVMRSNDTISLELGTGTRLNIKAIFPYRIPQYKDKTVVRRFYFSGGNFYTGETVYLYWIKMTTSILVDSHFLHGF